jgi:hypothetical protein
MAFNPFNNRPQHTKAEPDALFKGSSVTLQRLFIENRPLYDQCRAEYQQYNGIGPAPYMTEPERAELQKAPAQRNLSEAELRAIQKYSKEDSKAFFARDPGEPSNLPIPSKLRETAPAEYEERRLAAVVHGIFDRATAIVTDNTFKPAAPKPDAAETTVELGPVYSEHFNLPANTRVTPAEFEKMVRVKMEDYDRKMDELSAKAHALLQKQQQNNRPDDGDNGGSAPAAPVQV